MRHTGGPPWSGGPRDARIAGLIIGFAILVALLAWGVYDTIVDRRQHGEFVAVCHDMGGRAIHYAEGPDLCLDKGGHVVLIQAPDSDLQ